MIEFAPFRDIALTNKNEFLVSKLEFDATRFFPNIFKNIEMFEYRTIQDLERNNLIITPNGEIVRTVNGKDIKLGNAMTDSISKFLKERDIKMIRTLVAYDDREIKEEIVNFIEKIDDVQIVGTATDGEETYRKIVDLKPEMVFTKFDLDKMDGLEIIKKSKENMDKIPVFNIISDKILDSKVKEMLEVAGMNLNALIDENEEMETRVKTILKEYKEFKSTEL